jgi:hypothetical protein
MREKDLLMLLKNKEIELWTSSDVSKEIGKSRQYAHRLMRSGRIFSVFVCGVWLTAKECVKDFKK